MGRDLGASLSCFFCGLGVLLELGDQCSPIFYQFVKNLMDLIDGLTETILKTLINILISVVSFFIYLFSGTDNAFDLAIAELGKIFEYLGEMLLNLGQLILNFLLQIPIVGTIVQFFVNVVGEICGIIQDIVDAFTDPDQDIGCPPVDWENLKKRGVQGTFGWLKNVRPSIQATWDHELPVCRTRMTQLNNTAYEELTDTDRLDVFFCLFADHWIHTIEPESTVYSTVCEQQVLDFYDQRILWSQLQGRVNRAEVQWCGRMRWAMYMLREQGGYDYLPENLLDNPLLFVGFAVQMLYGFDVFSQYRSDRNTPLELINSEEYRHNWQVTGFGTTQLDALAQLPSDESRRIALATDDPALGLELEQYASRMSSVFKFKASHLAASARFWGRLFGQEPLYPAASLKRTAVPKPTQSLMYQFLNFTVRKMAQQRILPPPRLNLSLLTRPEEAVRNRQYLHLGTRALFKDVPIILAQTAVRASDMNLTGQAHALGLSIPRQFYAGGLAVLKIMGDVLKGRSNPLSSAWARSRPKESFQYGMTQMANVLSKPLATLGKGPGELFHLTTKLWTRSPVANRVRGQLSYVAMAVRESIAMAGRGDLSSSTVTCEIPWPEVCEQCGLIALPLNTLVMAPTQAVNYYAGSNETEPSFGHGYEAYMHLRLMLDDTSIPAEVGDSPELSPFWPWRDHNNLRILGDPTPNKGRLSNLTTIFWDVVDNLFATPLVAEAALNTATRVTNMATGAVQYLIDFYRALWDSRSVKQAIGKTTRLTISTLASSGRALLEYFVDWLRSCSYRNEINGSTKQFSIMEDLGILFLASVAFCMFINLFIPTNTMTLLMAIMGTFSVSTLVGLPLVIGYQYTPSCFPAIPYMLADDLTWGLTRTVWPQCDWLLSGIITNETLAGEPAYDGLTCRNCENYDDDTGWVVAQCFDPPSVPGGLGFQNIGRNVGFTLLQWFPDTVQSWNNTNWPVLSTLIHTRLVQSFFTNFTAYNTSSQVSWTNHWSCNLVHTTIPNYYVAQPIFKILAISLPLAMVVLSLMYGLLFIAFWMIMLGEASQAATLELTNLVANDTEWHNRERNLVGEVVFLGRLLVRKTRSKWQQWGQPHRNLYSRY